jgi:phage terminase small subunit
MADLTVKEAAFCAAYAKGAGKEEAALAAGYTKAGAAKAATRLLAKPKVKAHLDKILDRAATKAGWSVARVVERLGENDAAAIAGNPVVGPDGEVIGYRRDFTASTRCLELIGKHLGMFVEKVEHDATASFADLVRQATERREGRK